MYLFHNTLTGEKCSRTGSNLFFKFLSIATINFNQSKYVQYHSRPWLIHHQDRKRNLWRVMWTGLDLWLHLHCAKAKISLKFNINSSFIKTHLKVTSFSCSLSRRANEPQGLVHTERKRRQLCSKKIKEKNDQHQSKFSLSPPLSLGVIFALTVVLYLFWQPHAHYLNVVFARQIWDTHFFSLISCNFLKENEIYDNMKCKPR